MQNNNLNNYLQEDEIKLSELIKLLITSKKLVITITLATSLLGAIYSFQTAPEYKSTALMEIGNYMELPANIKFLELSSDENKLIESSSSLISNLKINFIHKEKLEVKMNSIEGRLIQFDIKSNNLENNIDILNQIVGYSINRYSSQLQKFINQLTYKIELINQQISQVNSSLLNEANKNIDSLNTELDSINISLLNETNNNLISVNNDLLTVEEQIKQIKIVILEDEYNLKLIKTDIQLLKERAAKSPTLNQVIYEYKAQLIKYKARKIYLLNEKDKLESQLKLWENNEFKSSEIFELSLAKDKLESQLMLWENNEFKSSEIFELSLAKDKLESQLMLLENNEFKSSEIFELLLAKDKLESQLKLLENNEFKSSEIFELSQEKDRLELRLGLLKQDNISKTKLVGEILTIDSSLSKKIIIVLSFIFGLIFSVVIVLINNSLNGFKEDSV